MNPEIDELERLSLALVANRFDRRRKRASVRLTREFSLIRDLDQTEAFLSAFKLSRFLKENRIQAKLIGAGSISFWAFLNGLSEVDPLQHGLPSERFLIAGSDRSVIFSIVVDNSRFQEVTDFIADRPNGDEFFSIHAATEIEQVPIRTVELIRKRKAPAFCLGTIPLTDHRTSAGIRSGDTDGLFQLEADEIREALPRLRSPGIVQIAALTAASQADQVEPGMLAEFVGREAAPVRRSKTSPTIQQIVSETNGLALFQEQIMYLLHKLAGIPLATAYRFVRGVAKRQSVASIRERFLTSANGSTLSPETAEEVIDDLQSAAVYATCKSHHLANAVTTWQAAYLKTHFREEFEEVIENMTVANG